SETAQAAHDLGPKGPPDGGFDAFDEGVAGVDVDSGGAIGEGVVVRRGHASVRRVCKLPMIDVCAWIGQTSHREPGSGRPPPGRPALPVNLSGPNLQGTSVMTNTPTRMRGAMAWWLPGLLMLALALPV